MALKRLADGPSSRNKRRKGEDVEPIATSAATCAASETTTEKQIAHNATDTNSVVVQKKVSNGACWHYFPCWITDPSLGESLITRPSTRIAKQNLRVRRARKGENQNPSKPQAPRSARYMPPNPTRSKNDVETAEWIHLHHS